MAYNPYINQFYQSNPYVQQPITQPQVPVTQTNTGITWVQGENAAKSYPVAPGNSVLLMDSENSVMYIKSTDQSGMPQPLRIFDYTERKAQNNAQQAIMNEDTHNYVRQEELDAFKREFELFRNEIKDTLKQSTINKVPIKKPNVKEN